MIISYSSAFSVANPPRVDRSEMYFASFNVMCRRTRPSAAIPADPRIAREIVDPDRNVYMKASNVAVVLRGAILDKY